MTIDEAYRRLAERTSHPDSEIMLSIISKAMTPEEARFILELPASNAELAAMLNQDENTIESTFQDLWRKGHLVTSRKGMRFPRNLEQWRDHLFCKDPESIPPEMGQLWTDFYESGWWRDLVDFWCMLEKPMFRVIPAQESISSVADVLSIESVKDLIEASELTLVRNCCCRIWQRKCDRPLFTCIQFGARAEEWLSRGRGRRVSADEAVTIALSAEESGLLPLIVNNSATEYICYCCDCCCVVLAPLTRSDKLGEGIAKSRFIAEVEPETCNGCQACMERCYFGAVEMKKHPDFKKLKAFIDPEKCFGCGMCAIKCEVEAITMATVRPPEHIPSTLA
ncbi:ATP-binding protein [Chloroflexota bacterium]